MEKMLYEWVIQAAELLNKVIGYADSEQSIRELRHSGFTVIGGKTCHSSAAPMRDVDTHLENQIRVKNSVELPKGDENTMPTVKYHGRKLTIYRRKDGRWWSRYSEDGKQVAVYAKTAEECQKKLLKELAAAEKRRLDPAPVKKYTFFEWMKFWYETYKEPYNKTDTILRQMRTHVTVGRDRPIENVTTTDLQLLINKIPSDRTRVDVCNILKAAFDIAFKTRVVRENPAVTLVKVTYKSKNGNALTREEEQRFLESVKGYYLEDLFKFYLISGCRRSEALKLNVADVDRKAGTVKIHGTKTENSERVIPLFRRLATFLDTLTPDKDGNYFPGVHEDTITQGFKRFCPTHKLHDLRHTFATRCLEAGVNMKTVQAWLGHADFETTANIYSHVNLDYQKEQALRLDLYFDSKSDSKL